VCLLPVLNSIQNVGSTYSETCRALATLLGYLDPIASFSDVDTYESKLLSC